MIFSGVDLSIVSLLSGSLPVLAGVALTLLWWLDDELGDARPDADPTPTPSPLGPRP
jgi:hypothetical protein